MARYLLPDRLPDAARSLFIASTSYQVILAHLLAADSAVCPEDSVLVLKHRVQQNFRDFFQALRGDPDTPFREVLFLDRPAHYKRRQRAWQDRRRLSTLRQLLAAVKPEQLFLFNEDALDQYLARGMGAYGGRVFAVEDGAVAYSAAGRRITRSEAFKNKLAFGPRTGNIRVEGGSRYIDAFFAVYPDLLRPELGYKPSHALPRRDGALFDGLSWPRDYLKRLGINLEDVRCDGLFALARTSNFKALPDHRTRMRQAVFDTSAAPGRYAISYHPSEKKRDVLDVGSHGIKLIHHAVPAELIYLFNRGRLHTVVGDIGTSLMTARWLLPRARVVSLMKSLEMNDPPFERTLRAIGVEVL